MIGDIFIGLLLIFSAAINLLAIGAFWSTPSLRTTTNRFVANLLIVNFLSCLVLSPAAFSPAITSSSASAAIVVTEGNTTGSLLNNISTLSPTLTENSTDISPVTSIKPVENIMERYQSCTLDFVVAVSVLSMLLVVLDTFIAVTDPLRYHSRISDVKAWLLIISCWILGIGVGIASAFQSSSEIIDSEANKVLSSSGCVYNTMFLLTYFLSIILTPFLLLILMYWRIFTEARENGQRMRQNGSSPLLQSALNLAASAAAANQSSTAQQQQQPHQKSQQQTNSLSSPHCLLLVTSPSIQSCKQLQENGVDKQTANLSDNRRAVTSDGLTMNIDKQDYYGVNNNSNQQINLNDNYHHSQHFVYPSGFVGGIETKTFLLSSPPHELMPFLPSPSSEMSGARGDSLSDDDDKKPSRHHQNILLTLTTACEAAAMKRNQSVKQLLSDSSLYNASHDESNFAEIRQVRSSPNLQNFYDDVTIDDRRKMSQQPPETLELPNSVQASPKALRYMNSLRHRLSNASSLFKYREEGRAARISILVVIMFLLTYFPYGLLSLIHGQESIIKESSLSFLSMLFVLLANLCSPFIFAYRNKRVRKGVQKLLGIDQKTNERLEKLNSLKKSYSIRLKNYRQSQLNKSFNFGSKSEVDATTRSNNIRRSQTFTTCKFLTPQDANVKTSSNGISYQQPLQQQQQPKKLTSSINIKEKKSILKIVCDGSRKLARGNNCQDVQQQQQVETMIGVGDDVNASQFDDQPPKAMGPVDV